MILSLLRRLVLLTLNLPLLRSYVLLALILSLLRRLVLLTLNLPLLRSYVLLALILALLRRLVLLTLNLLLLRSYVLLALILSLLRRLVLLTLNLPLLRCYVLHSLVRSRLRCCVLLKLKLSVVGIASLIKNSPSVVVITLILVITTIRPAVLNITIPSYVVPAIPSYLIRKSGIEDKNPRPAVIIRTVPAPIMVDVIPVAIVNDIVRAPD